MGAGGRTPLGTIAGALACVLVTLLAGPGCRGGDPAPATAPDAAGAAAPRFLEWANTPQPVGTASDWVSVHAEYLNTCGIRAGGSLWCWGQNPSGQLGDGSRTPHGEPHRVGADGGWASVDPADHHTCAQRRDGTLWCWGRHRNARTAAPGAAPQLAPAPVVLHADGAPDAPLAFTELSLGDAHACGLTADGAAWCWGKPGVLGDGTAGDAEWPRRVATGHIAPPPRFRAIETGTHHSCALTDDGRIFCWGFEDHGQLGDGGGRQDERSAPVPIDVSLVPGAKTFAALGASTYHACAVTTEGAAVCWGANKNGQLGTGDREDRPAPTPVDPSALPPGTAFTGVECGFDHTCALDREGRAWCWGYVPVAGVPGAKPPVLRPTAVDTTGLPDGTRFRAISAGVGHTCAITTEGRLYCWGGGAHGQLGGGALPAR